MNRLAILQNNLEFSRKVMNYIISSNKRICISSFAINPKEMMTTVYELKEGDILIVDLELSQIDVFEVIDELKQQANTMPFIIAISGDVDLFKKLKKIPNVYAKIKKPCAFSTIINIIEEITDISGGKCYEELVKEELQTFEVNVTTLGYKYIVDAIELSLANENLLRDMKHRLYGSISKRHDDVSIINIKWTIEKTIRSIMRYTSFDVVKSYFRVESGEKVTPKIFISEILENLKDKIDEETDFSSEKLYN
jgi:FixJ family two-component response regulator